MIMVTQRRNSQCFFFIFPYALSGCISPKYFQLKRAIIQEERQSGVWSRRGETGNKNKALSVVFSTLVVCMWFLHNQIYQLSGFILQQVEPHLDIKIIRSQDKSGIPASGGGKWNKILKIFNNFENFSRCMFNKYEGIHVTQFTQFRAFFSGKSHVLFF